MKLIGIGGYARSGKDTLGQLLKKNETWNPIIVRSLGEYVNEKLTELNPRVGDKGLYREVISEYGDYEKAKSEVPEIRKMLQFYGTEIGRNLDENYWIRLAWDDLSFYDQFAEAIIFTGIRFRNELDFIKENGGFSVWVESERGGLNTQHSSENSLLKEDFDLVVTNNGTLEELEEVADEIYFSIDTANVSDHRP